MKREDISKAVSGISAHYIEEAGNGNYAEKRTFLLFLRKPVFLTAMAASALLFIAIWSIRTFFFSSGMVVYAYTYGTEEKLTKAGAVIHTGTIDDGGEQKGHPLMFYLSGKNIESVRFSCKNQKLSFTDWTEEREEYGLAGNFTIPYGEDEGEYDYLTVDWVPEGTIKRLHEGSAIAELPEDLKEDLIVMEITFAGGKKAVKAIRVSLLEDGTFFAAFDDYEISPSDTFVNHADAMTLRERSQAELSRMKTEKEMALETLENGTEKNPAFEPEKQVDFAARKAAEEYYGGTVFEVISMEVLKNGEEEIVFSVCVSKDGVIQEPNRSIVLEKNDAGWEVVNEGY
ncbi:MAG: hypothetical protein HFI68_04975 [Lachnospiraceae bacterium]|nr:hypothetical protein [Lachnospiraceae bacterium]